MTYAQKLTSAYKTAITTLKGRLIVPYQREGVVWMLDRELTETHRIKGGFLCDEMGLGKTVQTISLILGNPDLKTLIIVPKSIVDQWFSEIARFAPQLKVLVHDGSSRTRDPSTFTDYDVVITPYTTMVERNQPHGTPTVVHKVDWGRVILDEGHEIRNPKSKISVSICNLTAINRWVLTGTPVFNRLKDFITLCKFIGIPKEGVQGALQSIRNRYVLRRTKEDVAGFNERLKLPPCDFANVKISMTADEKEFYDHVYNKCRERLKRIQVSTTLSKSIYIMEQILRIRQIMVHPQIYLNGMAKKHQTPPQVWDSNVSKIDKLCGMVSEHPTESTLIFCQFIEEMNIIQGRMEKMEKKVYRIDGSISREERVMEIDKFRKTPGCVFLIQIKAGGVGLNLQDATRVYITSPAWNPAVELQAIARAHRTGQTKKVTVRKLYYDFDDDEVNPSVEYAIMQLQNHKSIVCSEVLNDERVASQIPVPRKLGIKDIQKIFRI